MPQGDGRRYVIARDHPRLGVKLKPKSILDRLYDSRIEIGNTKRARGRCDTQQDGHAFRRDGVDGSQAFMDRRRREIGELLQADSPLREVDFASGQVGRRFRIPEVRLVHASNARPYRRKTCGRIETC